MDIDARQLLAPILQRGERALWAGQPRQGLTLRGSDALLIPFSLMWGGFAFFWEWGVVTSGAPALFALFGVPFMLMGLYVTVGRFFFDARGRASTVYAVTDRRVMIVSGVFRQTTTSLPLRTLPHIQVSEGRSGWGTITFGQGGGPMSWLGQSSWPGAGRNAAPAFDLIPDAQAVADLILRAQATAPAAV